MSVLRYLVVLLVLGVSTPGISKELPILTPAQAISQAKTGPVKGIFEFTVKHVGQAHKAIFLNSEQDYRLPTSLNVEVPRGLASDMQEKFGGDLEKLVGHRVRVSGTAKRVKIVLEAKRIGTTRMVKRRFYYQTQVRVRDLDDLTQLD